MAPQIKPDKIKKGDVILTASDDLRGTWPIKFANFFHGRGRHMKWTHAAMSLGGLDIVEAVLDPGVILENVQTKYVDKARDILVLRCKVLTSEKIEKVADHCKDKFHEGSTYDLWALSYFALRMGNPLGIGTFIDTMPLGRWLFEKHINNKNAYFCSELIAEAFQVNGLSIRKHRHPWQVMPIDLYNLSLFDKIKDIWQ